MRQRSSGVEPDDFGVRPISAQKNRMYLIRKIPVGAVAALAGNQTKILAARQMIQFNVMKKAPKSERGIYGP